MKIMPNVALCGSRDWMDKRKIKDLIWNLKQKLGAELTIISGGQKQGADHLVRKYALELGCKYIEFGPAFENFNLYSAMPEEYYGKRYHPTHLLHRNDLIVKNSDCGIVLLNKEASEVKICEHLIKRFKKFKKPVVILQ